jgi:PIN domain nuclease of toxin-antitoxin system
MLEDPAQIPLFSVASLWELVIKAGLNRAGFDVQAALLRRALLDAGWQELPLLTNHVTAVADLPLLHRDPFDRLLLAQAKAEAMLLMTADQQLAGYPGPIRWMASL